MASLQETCLPKDMAHSMVVLESTKFYLQKWDVDYWKLTKKKTLLLFHSFMIIDLSISRFVFGVDDLAKNYLSSPTTRILFGVWRWFALPDLNFPLFDRLHISILLCSPGLKDDDNLSIMQILPFLAFWEPSGQCQLRLHSSCVTVARRASAREQ